MDSIEKAISFIKESSNIVCFTGAGASTESNIPDFRSNSGLYNEKKDKYKYPPEVMLSHSFFYDHTSEFFDYYKNNMIYKDAQPNDCHKILAKLEEMGKLKAIVTQNIDGLHQLAGSKNVIELHGSVYRNNCTRCGKAFDLNYVLEQKDVPVCDKCGGIVKPDVVLYEESLNENNIESAVSFIRNADVLLVIGSSLLVYPAAGLIRYYKGNKLILINNESTPYDDYANIIIHEKAGTVMKKIYENIER